MYQGYVCNLNPTSSQSKGKHCTRMVRTKKWQLPYNLKLTYSTLLLSLQVLELIGNPISQLGDEVFFYHNFMNLQEIILSQCQINVIERHAFKELNNLGGNQVKMQGHTYHFLKKL